MGMGTGPVVGPATGKEGFAGHGGGDVIQFVVRSVCV